MTSKERVLAAFAKEPTDKVPIHHIGFSSEVASHLLGREAYVGGGIQQWREATALWHGEDAHQEFVERSFRDAIDIALLCDHDIIRPNYWGYSHKPSKKLDENIYLFAEGPEEGWTVMRFDPPSEQCRIFKYRPQAEPTFEELEAQISASEKRVEDYQPTENPSSPTFRAQQMFGEDYVIRTGGGGIGIPTSRIWLEATLLRPDLVERSLEVEVERARRSIPFLVAHGFRLFWGGSDFASYEGPMYSPRVFDELLLPRLQRISEIVHANGGFYLFASDGNLWPVADGLFGKSGIDGYYEIDRRAGMDLGRLRREFPDLTLIGNINSHTTHLGSREEIVAETMSCIHEAERSGGIIVGTSNYFVPGTPVENVEAILETIRQHR